MWTRGEDKLVELLLVRCFPRWNFIAARLLGKTPEQVSQRLECVVDEVTRLFQALEVDTPREWDAQQVGVAAPPPAERQLPNNTVAADVIPMGGEAAAVAEGKGLVPPPSSAAAGEPSGSVAKKKKRKKAVKWTKEEHELFLRGLEIYGVGKWKVMSMEYLTTKAASQIASHYQKHCKRLEQRKRNGCKRASIHDITAPTTSGGEQPNSAQKDVGSGQGESVGAVEEFPGDYDPGTLFT